MGSDTSKPAREHQRQADEYSHHDPNEFRIISPTSDLSNPSDFHHVIRPQPQPSKKNKRRGNGGKNGSKSNRRRNQQKVTVPTSAQDRRRTSRVITKSIPDMKQRHKNQFASNGVKQHNEQQHQKQQSGGSGKGGRTKNGRQRQKRANHKHANDGIDNLQSISFDKENQQANADPDMYFEEDSKGFRKVKQIFGQCISKDVDGGLLEPIMEERSKRRSNNSKASRKKSLEERKAQRPLAELAEDNAFGDFNNANAKSKANAGDDRRKSRGSDTAQNKDAAQFNDENEDLQQMWMQNMPFAFKEDVHELVMPKMATDAPQSTPHHMIYSNGAVHQADEYFDRLAQNGFVSATKQPHPSPYVVAKEGSISSYSTLTQEHLEANQPKAATPMQSATLLAPAHFNTKAAAAAPPTMLGDVGDESSNISLDLFNIASTATNNKPVEEEPKADGPPASLPFSSPMFEPMVGDIDKSDDVEVFQDEASTDDIEESEADDVVGELPSSKKSIEHVMANLDTLLPKTRVSLESNDASSASRSVGSQSASKPEEQEESQLKLSALTLGSFAIQQAFSHDDSHLQQALAVGNHNLDDESDAESDAESYFKPEEVKKRQSTAVANMPLNPIQQVASLKINTGGPQNDKRSKLESLFRPILPTMSADDAESLGSFDPYEIKVTESAPSMMESQNFERIAWDADSPANSLRLANSKNITAIIPLISPSMMSIDSQAPAPSSTIKGPVSGQAMTNGAFLFQEKYAEADPTFLLEALQQKKAKTSRRRDSDIFSIATIASRTVVSSRSEAAKIPVKKQLIDYRAPSPQSSAHDELADRVELLTLGQGEHYGSRTTSKVQATATGSTLEIPGIESKMSDLTDTFSLTSLPTSSIAHHHASTLVEPQEIIEEMVNESTYLDDNEDATVTGAGTSVDKIDQPVEDDEGNETVLAEDMRSLNEALKRQSRVHFAPTNSPREQDFVIIPEEGESATQSVNRESLESANSGASGTTNSSEQTFHWVYRKDGDQVTATPFGKGKKSQYQPTANATNSPFLRFKAAKNIFSDATAPAPAAAAASVEAAPAPAPVVQAPSFGADSVSSHSRSSLKKQSQAKAAMGKKESPVVAKKSKAQVKRKNRRTSSSSAASSVVSTRISELNKRVSDMRKLRRKRHSSTGVEQNGSCMNPPLIRTQVIMNYKIDALATGSFGMSSQDDSISVDEESCASSQHSRSQLQYLGHTNAQDISVMSAASDILYRINSIPESPEAEDAEVENSHYVAGHSVLMDTEGDFSDDHTRSSHATMSTVSTIRQDRSSALNARFAGHRESTGSVSTMASSRISSLRNDVFRDRRESSDTLAMIQGTYSTGASTRYSLASSGESTTMSAILDKENANAMPFRQSNKTVKPVEQMQRFHSNIHQDGENQAPAQNTPGEARKWRQLAAAAKENDSARKPNGKGLSAQKSRGLSVRNFNTMNNNNNNTNSLNKGTTKGWNPSGARTGLSFVQ